MPTLDLLHLPNRTQLRYTFIQCTWDAPESMVKVTLLLMTPLCAEDVCAQSNPFHIGAVCQDNDAKLPPYFNEIILLVF